MSEREHSNPEWASDIARLLDDLGSIQEEVLGVLEQKRKAMIDDDLTLLEGLQKSEEQLGQRLTVCHERRQELLASAKAAGLPHDSLGSLATSVDTGGRGSLPKQVKHASRQMRLLQHSSLTNWVVTQRTLIHLSQMLEIIAFGGRLNPTYGDTNADLAGGALVDREV